MVLSCCMKLVCCACGVPKSVLHRRQISLALFLLYLVQTAKCSSLPPPFWSCLFTLFTLVGKEDQNVLSNCVSTAFVCVLEKSAAFRAGAEKIANQRGGGGLGNWVYLESENRSLRYGSEGCFKKLVELEDERIRRRVEVIMVGSKDER